MISRLFKIPTTILLLTLCANAHAWQLDNDQSSVSFVTIKKTNIGESHTFSSISGNINDGKASIVINAESVDTLVGIRNERLRKFLFETELYPSIEVDTDVSKVLADLQEGSSDVATLDATLNLHGVSQNITLNVRASKLSDSLMVVTTTQPVIIRAADYVLVDGIVKLSNLMNGLHLAQTVPVSFSLVFTQ